MKHTTQIVRLLHLISIGSALATVCPTTLLAQSGAAQLIAGSPVPPVLDVPAGNEAYLKAAAVGTQNYLCLPSGWTFLGPQATLFVDLPWGRRGAIRQQIATHFLSPNPAEGGAPRPTWESSFDTSTVWATPVASSSDSSGPGSIPWLLLEVAGAAKGPIGGFALSETTYIQRVNTYGGLMPTTVCAVGMRAFVPYTADYIFYRKVAR